MVDEFSSEQARALSPAPALTEAAMLAGEAHVLSESSAAWVGWSRLAACSSRCVVSWSVVFQLLSRAGHPQMASWTAYHIARLRPGNDDDSWRAEAGTAAPDYSTTLLWCCTTTLELPFSKATQAVDQGANTLASRLALLATFFNVLRSAEPAWTRSGGLP